MPDQKHEPNQSSHAHEFERLRPANFLSPFSEERTNRCEIKSRVPTLFSEKWRKRAQISRDPMPRLRTTGTTKLSPASTEVTLTDSNRPGHESSLSRRRRVHRLTFMPYALGGSKGMESARGFRYHPIWLKKGIVSFFRSSSESDEPSSR